MENIAPLISTFIVQQNAISIKYGTSIMDVRKEKSIPVDNDANNRALDALIIEDEMVSAMWLQLDLERNGISCDVANSYASACAYLDREHDYDLYLIDYSLGIANETGLDACKYIRKISNSPIIFVSGCQDSDVIVNCLAAGADQFILKPYKKNILKAHIYSALRRVYGEKHLQEINQEDLIDLSLDKQIKCLKCGESRVQVSNKEMLVMELLLSNISNNICREDLEFFVSNNSNKPNPRYVDNIISRLRKKLSQVTPRYKIITVHDSGYALIKSE